MKPIIQKAIEDALKKMGLGGESFSISHPEDSANGDYSSNVALIYGKKVKENPGEFARRLVPNIVLSPEMAKIEVAGPGFVNFFLHPEFFTKEIERARKERDAYGSNERLAGQKAIVEYTDPNPFKDFHIGHLMPNVIGESIARIIQFCGAELVRACYMGDVGMHVAKAIWGYQKIGDWDKAYAYGTKAFLESEEVQKEVVDLNKKIYRRTDEALRKIYEEGKQRSLDSFEVMYRRLGTTFDQYYFESETWKVGEEIVRQNLGTVFEAGDNGAVIFRGEKYDSKLHTRVFINSEGLPTYETKELGLARMKYDRRPYDLSVVVTGNEVDQYFQVLLRAMREVLPELGKKTKHISHGMLRLPTGKMSSRTGDVITAHDLLADVAEKVVEKVKDSNRGEMSESFIDSVSVSALKYSILRQAIGMDVIFEFDKSISMDGDSGPYLQYAFARSLSLGEKAKEEGVPEFSGKRPEEISEVERLIYQFGEKVERSAEDLEPHHIASYLIILARAFNAYYGSNKIVDPSDPFSPFRVALADAFSVVLKNGLSLLGIHAPEKM